MEWAEKYSKDARLIEAVLQESKNIIRKENGILITETKHGFICANSGIDNSNVKGDQNICLLPKNPDLSCKKIKDRIKKQLSKNVSVVMTDTFGRPWRTGAVNVAIGVSGMDPMESYVGEEDDNGNLMYTTVICVADELAAASELVMGKTSRIPVALIRGYDYIFSDSASSKSLIRDPDKDMFR